MARRCSALIAAALAVAIPAAPALAQPAPAAPGKPADPKQTAKAYVDAGVAAQNAGDYDTALQFFGKAYELVPHPVLLFNMAQANRLAGRLVPAITLYQQYVAAEPKGAQAKIAREFITALGAQVAAEQARVAEEAKRKAEAEQAAAAAAAAEAAAAEQRRADERQRAEEARRAEAAAAEARAVEQRAEADRRARGRGLRVGGLVAAGAGIAGLGAGAYFGLRARALSDDLSTPGHVYDPDDDAAGKSAETTMIIATAAGGALLVGGTVLYLVGRARGRAGDTRLAPVVAPTDGGAALGLGGAW